MFNYQNWIVKKEKPFLNRYGFHHAGTQLAAIVPLFFIGGILPSAAAYGWICKHYYGKEKRENGAKTEIFDFATQAVIGLASLLVLKWLLHIEKITHLLEYLT